MSEANSFLTTASIWTGVSVGLLKVVDWLLSDTQKKWLTEKSEIAWFWLSEQRVGKFTVVLRHPNLQIAFAIL